ncbi:MAG: tetratricopeptide repeat protein [Desulfuromonadaceae bacterium]|nr:tetratricopeptide repeat protein [Desulfuromonadaceae bacterium]
MSKELALGVLPFIAALEISIWRNESQSRSRMLVRLVPYLLTTFMYWVLRSNAFALADVKLEIFQGMMSRLIYNVYIIPKYFFSLVLPINLSPFYLIPEELRPIALQLGLSWGIIVVVLWWLIKNGTQTTVCFGLAWLVIFWLPVSGIVDIPSSPVADRFFYLPALGAWILAGEHLARLYTTETGNKVFRHATIMVLFFCLAGLTFRQNQYWKNGVTLFSRVLQFAPESVYAYHNLGCAYLEEQKNLPLAEKAFTKAMMLDPAFPRLQDQLGYIRMQRGDYSGALQHYREAIRQNSLDAEAHLNSAILLEKLSHPEDALVEYQRFYASPGVELAGARDGVNIKMTELSRLIAKRKAASGIK